MIRPEELVDVRDAKLEVTLEEKFDDAIKEANKRGVWPAEVSRMRMVIAKPVIDAVCQKYRLVGWQVNQLCDSNSYAEISRPPKDRFLMWRDSEDKVWRVTPLRRGDTIPEEAKMGWWASPTAFERDEVAWDLVRPWPMTDDKRFSQQEQLQFDSNILLVFMEIP